MPCRIRLPMMNEIARAASDVRSARYTGTTHPQHGRPRGTGSNRENTSGRRKSRRYAPARRRCASVPIAIDPMPNTMLTPNQIARKASTRRLRKARVSDSAGTFAAASASPRLKREEAAPHEGEADRGRHGAGHRGRGTDHRRHRMLVGDQMRQRAGRRGHRHEQENREGPKRRANALPNGNSHNTLKPIWLRLACSSE